MNLNGHNRPSDEAAPTQLKREIGLIPLTLYGLGVTIGAGIFVLIGETAGLAGGYAPIAFFIAGAVAALSALSYAELVTRFPVSAGEAAYVKEAFSNHTLSRVVGFGVVLVGVLSSATILQGFAGYASALLGISGRLAALAALAVITCLTLTGVRQSVWGAALLTIVELGILTFVAIVAAPVALSDPVPPGPFLSTGVIAAAAIAFFAYIGFEDIVNIVEETQDPKRVMPKAIILTLIISTVIYAFIVLIAVRSTPAEILAATGDPIPEILRAVGSDAAGVISVLSMFAILNGALVQLIMGSRVLYGMAKQGDAPTAFSALLKRAATPYAAILAVSAVIAVLSLSFPLGGLARATSVTTLSVFALVNLSLIVISRRAPTPADCFKAPTVVPYLGLVGAVALMAGALI